MARHPLSLIALVVTLASTAEEVRHASLLPITGDAAAAIVGSLRSSAPEPDEPQAEVAPSPKLAQAVTAKIAGGGAVYLPAGLPLDDSGGYDLVLHFHGDPTLLEKEIDQAGASVVLATINLGMGSRVYIDRFAAPIVLDHTLAAIDAIVRKASPSGRAERKHLALSAWSAGYGALQKILSHEESLARVDAVVVEDGLHGSFADRPRRIVAPLSLEPFVRFGELAVSGDKAMFVTHSAVETYGYASTTETARHLVAALSLEPCEDAPEPGRMRASGCHRRGAVELWGYAGGGKQDHCDHLQNFAALVITPLLSHWYPQRESGGA
jgi:hypothetical protein